MYKLMVSLVVVGLIAFVVSVVLLVTGIWVTDYNLAENLSDTGTIGVYLSAMWSLLGTLGAISFQEEDSE